MAAPAAALLHLPGYSRSATSGLPPRIGRPRSSFPVSYSSLPSPSPSPSSSGRVRGFSGVRAFYNPLEDPILKEALKEPVAFMGGMFAGLLRLDLNEEPLREWITRTVEASGITEEDLSTELKADEDAPQQIEIE